MVAELLGLSFEAGRQPHLPEGILVLDVTGHLDHVIQAALADFHGPVKILFGRLAQKLQPKRFRFGRQVQILQDIEQRARITAACVAREHHEAERLLDAAERWLRAQEWEVALLDRFLVDPED